VNTVKVLTVRQPWASAIFYSNKNIENRTWGTPYRGPVVIHAGKTPDKNAPESVWTRARETPLGVALGIVDLIDITRGHPSPWAQRNCFNWVLAKPELLVVPLPMRGQRGLFKLDPELAADILSQLYLGDTDHLT
jgi:hypothetical protein